MLLDARAYLPHPACVHSEKKSRFTLLQSPHQPGGRRTFAIVLLSQVHV